jgi:adenosylmethionine---8-amino-7-oxononanoate aminotransferase
MDSIARLDHEYVWHPFTQMREWLKREPIVIAEGHGAVLKDRRGREYLDANSSIWTNLHGHNHPELNRAITRQLKRIAHSSALGLANGPASLLAERLVKAANAALPPRPGKKPRHPSLAKVFFSDDGSTAMEVALKLAYEVARRSGQSRPKFLSLDHAYHGDTVGAVSLGHIDLFHKSYSQLLFRTDKTPAPYCYRCPHNRAKPERADARTYRKCNEECLVDLERTFVHRTKKNREPYAAFVFEPLIQGAAGMIAQPEGWLAKATKLARSFGAALVADEVMTGFGRTGMAKTRERRGSHEKPLLFACQSEGVAPDYLALAKGMTGGYLPMAATLTTQKVFDAFLGNYDEFKTFFHGHSFTANQLGAAASFASLDLLETEASIRGRSRLQKSLTKQLETLWKLPAIGDIRQVGLIAGIELVRDWRTRAPFEARQRVGARVCEAMAGRGVLTRPIGDVIVIMPPYCASDEQLHRMIGALRQAVAGLHA